MSNGSGAPALVWHVSYRSEDAVEFDDDTGTWTFASGIPRLKIFKTTLVSLEFPLSQRTIEEPFSQFFFSEGYLVGPMCREVHMQELVPSLDSLVPIDAILPLAFQYGTITNVVGATVTIETLNDARTSPANHGLFIGPAATCVADMWPDWAGERIRVVLPGLIAELECFAITMVSSTEFNLVLTLPLPAEVVIGALVILYAPAIRSPREGAALLQWVICRFPILNNYRVTFDNVSMTTTIEAVGDIEHGSRFSVFPGGRCSLMSWMGWACETECTAAGSPNDSVGWLGEAQLPVNNFWSCSAPDKRRTLSLTARPECIDVDLRESMRAQLSRPGNEFDGFRSERPPALGGGPPQIVLKRLCDRYVDLACQSNMWVPGGQVRIRPGWYGPAQRPNGPTENLNIEVDLQMAPLRLAPPPDNQALPVGVLTIHNIVLESTLGSVLVCPIQMGHYTPDIMAQTIQATVQAQALISAPGVGWPGFRAAFRTNRFIFCDVNGLPFGLRFDSPFMFDPRRLGFEPQRYFGSTAYDGNAMVLPRRKSRGPEAFAAPSTCVTPADVCPGCPPTLPTCEEVACPGWPINWYSMIDGGQTRKFRFVGNPPRSVRVACADCPSPPGLGCAAAQPPTPPFPPGAMLLQTVIEVALDGGGTVMVPFALPYQEFDIVVLSDMTTGNQHWSVVLEDAGQTGLDGNGSPMKQLMLFAPGLTQAVIGCAFDWTVQSAPQYSPMSLAFPPPNEGCVNYKSIPSDIMGFPYGAALWQPDSDNTIYAPALMNLDHVDYVLMEMGFDNLRKTDTFQVAGKKGNTVAFAKLVMYPQYQIHGMLPRDLITANMDSMERFQVRFVNPDLSRYFVNGRGFSFTLALTSPLGTM
jgi:hypothetical protein